MIIIFHGTEVLDAWERRRAHFGQNMGFGAKCSGRSWPAAFSEFRLVQV